MNARDPRGDAVEDQAAVSIWPFANLARAKRQVGLRAQHIPSSTIFQPLAGKRRAVVVMSTIISAVPAAARLRRAEISTIR